MSLQVICSLPPLLYSIAPLLSLYSCHSGESLTWIKPIFPSLANRPSSSFRALAWKAFLKPVSTVHFLSNHLHHIHGLELFAAHWNANIELSTPLPASLSRPVIGIARIAATRRQLSLRTFSSTPSSWSATCLEHFGRFPVLGRFPCSAEAPNVIACQLSLARPSSRDTTNQCPERRPGASPRLRAFVLRACAVRSGDQLLCRLLQNEHWPLRGRLAHDSQVSTFPALPGNRSPRKSFWRYQGSVCSWLVPPLWNSGRQRAVKLCCHAAGAFWREFISFGSI